MAGERKVKRAQPTQITQFTYLEPIRIKIERGQRGGVGWEISVHGNDPEKVLSQIAQIEAKLVEYELKTPPTLRRTPITTTNEEE